MSDSEKIENLYKQFVPGTLWKSFHYKDIGYEKEILGDWYFFRNQNTVVVPPDSCLFVLESPKLVFRYQGDTLERGAGSYVTSMKILLTPGQMGWLCFHQPRSFQHNPLLFFEEIK